jgi:hypothetical protein
MSLRLDWKFWLVLIATLAGVLVPVWLWRADLAARSLHFRQISRTSLQPPDTAKTLDLKVSVAGTELQSPYLTVVELLNDGTRPVPAADFESPIELATTEKTTIVRATITAAKPPDLAPSIAVEDGKMKLKPMLLNPGDSLTIAILTTGAEPTISSRARIAGVPSVPVIDAREKSHSPIRSIVLLAAALLYFAASSLVVGGWPSQGVRLRPRSAFLVFLVAAFGGALPLTLSLEALGVDGFWPLVGVFIGCMMAASVIAGWINRPEKKPSDGGGAA